MHPLHPQIRLWCAQRCILPLLVAGGSYVVVCSHVSSVNVIQNTIRITLCEGHPTIVGRSYFLPPNFYCHRDYNFIRRSTFDMYSKTPENDI